MSNAKVETIWQEISPIILNNIKIYLMQNYVAEIIRNFSIKIEYVVNKYAKYLPQYVVESEIDDLKTIARLEFLETLKVWNPEKNEDIWPLAQARMVGAMKDHIRYITKSDPTRFYDWVSDAAHFFLAMKDRADFEHQIETGVELNKALDILSYRDRKIIILYTQKDLTFKEIGNRLNISESQVSRIYKKAIKLLKKELSKP